MTTFGEWMAMIYPRLRRSFADFGSPTFSRDQRHFMIHRGSEWWVWDLVTGNLQVSEVGDSSGAYSSNVSPDGSKVLLLDLSMGGFMQYGKLIDSQSGDTLKEFFPASHIIRASVFVSNSLLITGGEQGEIIAWNLADGTSRKLPSSHDADVESLAPFQSGRVLVSASKDGIVQVLDLSDDSARVLANEGHHVSGCLVSPDERLVAYTIDEQMHGVSASILKARTLAAGTEIVSIRGPRSADGITGFTFTPDSADLVVLSGSPGAIRVINLGTSQARACIDEPQSATSPACSSDGRLLAYTCIDGSIRIADLRTGSHLARLCLLTNGHWLVLAADGRFDTDDANPGGEHCWGMHPDALRPLPDPESVRAYHTPGLLASLMAFQ